MSSLAVLLANPAAGAFSRDVITIAAEIVRQKGLKHEILLSSRPGEVEDLARKALDLSPEMIFVFGGDGTFNEAANGLVHSGVPLACIPTGTANVLARELDLPAGSADAVNRALESRPMRISLGKVNSSWNTGHYFIMMAGAGFDAEAVHRVSPSMKRSLGRGAYILSGLKVIFHYDPALLEVRTGNGVSEGYAVIVGNGSHYGGRYRITPDASLSEPCFQVFLLKKKSRSSLLRTALRVVRSKPTGGSDGEYITTDHVEIAGNTHLQTDGDYRGVLPADIAIERDCLDILC